MHKILHSGRNVLFRIKLFLEEKNKWLKKLWWHYRRQEIERNLIVRLNKKTWWPTWAQFKQLPHYLSTLEKNILRISTGLIVCSVVGLGINYYFTHTKVVPAAGGEYTEGLIGQPITINPVLAANNDVDMDLTALIYSGLFKYNEDLVLVPDLAESYSVSPDQKEFTIKVRPGVTWHDGEAFSVDDVIFTANIIKDSAFKSPIGLTLRGVEISKVDDSTVKFVLPESYAPFINGLTFGILPQHLWGTITATNFALNKYNLDPVGTGPYRVSKKVKDQDGNFRSYTLDKNINYYGGEIFIDKLTFKFYPSLDGAISALENHNVQGLSFLPKEVSEDFSKPKSVVYKSLSLPQYSALFFNQEQAVLLKDKNVRQALTYAINRLELVQTVLGGEGAVANGPILPGFIGYNENLAGYNYSLEEANKLLDAAKWQGVSPEDYLKILASKEDVVEGEVAPAPDLASLEGQEFFRKKGLDYLKLTITTVDHPETIAAVDFIKQAWQKIGVDVEVKIVAPTKISQDIIKKRDYQILLYSEIIGSDPDPYPFWHSSQAGDPGLNLAMYRNSQADKLIEDARQTSDVNVRAEKYRVFQELLANDLPAIFLYYPIYTYVVDANLAGLSVKKINVPADRFADITRRYIKTKRIWQ